MENNTTPNKNAGIYIVVSDVSISNSKFSNQGGEKDCKKGCFIYSGEQSNVTIDSSSFDNGEASESGGVLYAGSGSKINLTSVTIRDAKAITGSAIFSSFNTELTVTSSTFTYLNATDTGGIYLQYSTKIIIRDSSFSNCTATNEAAGVYAFESKKPVTVTNTDFTDMTSGTGAAILKLGSGKNNDKLDISHSRFMRTTVKTGGSISLAKSELTMTSSTCDTFTGSAISAVESKMTLRDVTI